MLSDPAAETRVLPETPPPLVPEPPPVQPVPVVVAPSEAVADLPAGLDPDELGDVPPTSARRGKLRRRVAFLRAARELLLRDLGGFVYELHRTAHDIEAPAHHKLRETKLARLSRVDAELHDLEILLDDVRRQVLVREPGVGGECPQCGEYFSSFARFCTQCGLPLTESARREVSRPMAGPEPAPIVPAAVAQPTDEIRPVDPAHPAAGSEFQWPARPVSMEKPGASPAEAPTAETEAASAEPATRVETGPVASASSEVAGPETRGETDAAAGGSAADEPAARAATAESETRGEASAQGDAADAGNESAPSASPDSAEPEARGETGTAAASASAASASPDNAEPEARVENEAEASQSAASAEGEAATPDTAARAEGDAATPETAASAEGDAATAETAARGETAPDTRGETAPDTRGETDGPASGSNAPDTNDSDPQDKRPSWDSPDNGTANGSVIHPAERRL